MSLRSYIIFDSKEPALSSNIQILVTQDKMEFQSQLLLSMGNGSSSDNSCVRAEAARTPKASSETKELGSCGWRLGHATSSLATLMASVTIYMLESTGGGELQYHHTFKCWSLCDHKTRDLGLWRTSSVRDVIYVSVSVRKTSVWTLQPWYILLICVTTYRKQKSYTLQNTNSYLTSTHTETVWLKGKNGQMKIKQK